jgi:hypothetical protein
MNYDQLKKASSRGYGLGVDHGGDRTPWFGKDDFGNL